MAVALFSIALDHREAILCLVRHGARSSAVALARSVYEAHVRGSWVRLCSTESECEAALRGGQLPKIETMIRQLDAVPDTDGVFSKVKRVTWGTLSDYAHGGMHQVRRWIGDDEIGPQHSDAEMLEVLWFLDVYALLCCVGLADMCDLPIAPYVAKVEEITEDFRAARSVEVN